MKKTDFDILKLSEITCQIFEKNKIDPKSYPNVLRTHDNPWIKICELYFGFSCNKKALLIYSWFKRNTDNFAKIVEYKLKNPKLNDISSFKKNKLKQLMVEFESTEFNSFKISGVDRKRLLTDFEEVLNKKLQQNGLKCYFRCSYNWFRKTTDPEYKQEIWSGLYKCIEPKCSNFIKPAIVKQTTEKISINVYYLDDFDHPKIQKQFRITGDEREVLGHRMKSEGIVNTYNTINISSFQENKKNLIRLNTLQKLKNEIENCFRLSRDLIFDLKATKVFCENLGFSTNSELKGYVHNICLDPYGFLLISHIQIKIWNSIKINCPVWFFDATGSVHKEINGQKKPLLYSIVMHDLTKKQILPLAEFLTTDQTTKSISSFLHFVDYNLQENINKTEVIIAPIIVTDFSWALINSILDVFNKISVKEYLQWCFSRIFSSKKKEAENTLIYKTRIYLCSTHFLKLLVNKTKKEEVEPSIRSFFIFCFSMLQNSVTIVQFNNYLINIFNIFNNPFQDPTIFYSITTIRNEIKKRNLDFYDFSSFEEENLLNFTKYENDREKDDISNETLESIRKSSPFTAYYDSILEHYKENIKNKKIKNEKNDKNIFYNPKLFTLITDQLYILPFWSGILIEDYKKENTMDLSECLKTRLSNNPVECYFGILKNRILLNRKVYPSEFVSLNFLRTKSKYLEHYFDDPKSKKVNENLIIKSKEKWSDKKSIKKRKRFHYEIDLIKEKGFYYKNKDIFKIIYQELFEFDPKMFKITSTEFNKTSFFIDEFIKNTKKENEPMEIDNLNEDIILDTENTQINFDLYKTYLFEITNELSFENCKKIIIDNKKIFTDLTKFLRSKKNLVLYSNQETETYKPFNLILELFDLKNFVPVLTRGDGNCFYRAVSYCIFGTDEYFYLIKIGSLFIFIEYQDIFEKIIEKQHYERKLDFIFCTSKKENEWAMSLNIFATSILLNRAIYSYALNSETFVTYGQIYISSNSESEPIRLGFFINHFIALLNKKNQCFDPFENGIDLFVNIRNDFKIDFYE